MLSNRCNYVWFPPIASPRMALSTHPPLHVLALHPGFALRDVAKSFLMVDVRQSQASVPLDRTTILDRVAGIDGRGHRTLNLQVGLGHTYSC